MFLTAMRNNKFLIAALSSTFVFAACGEGDANTFTANNPNPAAAVTVTSGDAQTGGIRTPLTTQLAVTVTDSFGAPDAHIAVPFSTTSDGYFTPIAPVTDENGVARTTFTLGSKAGAQTATATVAGVLVPAVFTHTATAGAAVAIGFFSGQSQSGAPGTALPLPVTAIAIDYYGNAVAGVPVTWTIDNGTITSSTAVTDVNGKATANVTLPAAFGWSTLTVKATGITGATALTLLQAK